jgi:twitching motility two-component system response regulator PilG
MRKKIILIEDDIDACILFKQVLTHAGYDVEYQHAGNNILTPAHQPADLYILDNCIPNIDGIALTKYLKLKEHTRKNPVLIISGNPSISNKAKMAGASAFIEKPFDVSYFLQTVHRLINDSPVQSREVHALATASSR